MPVHLSGPSESKAAAAAALSLSSALRTEKQGIVGKILEVDNDHLAQPQLGCLFPREDEARAQGGAAADGNDDVCVRSGNRMGRSSTRAAMLSFQDEDEGEDKEETDDNSA